MLSFSEFKNEFIKGCTDSLITHTHDRADDKIVIDERTLTKAQYGNLTGLIFRAGDSECAPTIYVEDFYDMYKRGSSVSELYEAAVSTVLYSIENAPDLTEDSLTTPDRLHVRLLNKSGNKDYLENVPHLDVGCGLALIAEVISGEFRAVITNELAECYEMDQDEMLEAALVNTSHSDPPVLFELTELLAEGRENCKNLLGSDTGFKAESGFGPEERSDSDSNTEFGFDQEPRSDSGSASDSSLPPSVSLYVLSNTNCFWGAAALFYPDVMARLHELMRGPFYIIPSSVHELLLLPISEGDPQQLVAMIREANRTVVSKDEFLSDDLLICESDQLRKISYGGFIPDPGSLPC